ncbi:ArnT family glycosyltransferase [Algoriphagus machipongonensis]|uniref:Dolichyl-phosphate-mannose-protein mannosyltransferase n=1 Tax=Algoriphagus machipongonensis TaxID=388413 RepID=A3HVT5_9BACT|nr:glycosyltransferase family 39 protein [Algoriphagus machipongonensis]EAZ82257.1 dolichyl-phosphate-mannose-protein mannosyltransferase [Algoriphagus machipongonensis]
MSLKEAQINPWVIMAVFTLLVGPFALNFHMHFPDEMYYSDAAVKMLQNGDYLTTYLGNGELRFRKPIGTYWVVLAGFKLFGVSAFSSRIFFLIAGALTVGLTYLLSKVLFENKKVAGISALIIASNPVLIFAATRSIPDVLLGLTMTASAIGFAGLIRYGDKVPKKFLWILYLSLALAFEVKGLPALALGGLGFIFLISNPWQKIHLKTLFHFPALILSLFIGLFWFVAMWKIHGPTYLDSFLSDQVGNRVQARIWLILKNGTIAFFTLLAVFLPWLLFATAKLKKTLKTTWNENKAFFLFALIWGLGIVAMGAMTAKFYERYLLPVAPVVAVFLGWNLHRAGLEFKKLGLKIAIAVFLLLNLILIALGLWININLGSGIWVYFQVVFAALVWLYLLRLTLSNKKLPKALSYSILLIFFTLSIGTLKISLPDQGSQLADFVKTNQIKPSDEIGFIGNIHVSSKIRIGLGPDFYMTDITGEKNLTQEEILVKASHFSKLIVEDDFLPEFQSDSYTIEVASINWDSKKIPYLIQQVNQSGFPELVKENGKIYYWLERKQN